MRVGAWLKNYVYLRVGPFDKRPSDLALHFTNVLGAVWHGLYIGYHVTYWTTSMRTDLARRIRRRFRPYFVSVSSGIETPHPSKKLYDLGGLVSEKMMMSYTMVPLVVLYKDATWKYLTDLYFSGHLVLVFGYVFLFILDVVMPIRRPKKEA
eukprot:TRINITY_DN7961_c0_g1_i2.p2 TRINITY_DN7961_c0_g1~~TRINITY_DN7961_c0_g1_i2.p2  ORF type:complete len:152 (-),score=31.05 TRINITY_DN7961_c0_g1_i2:33-488(-)